LKLTEQIFLYSIPVTFLALIGIQGEIRIIQLSPVSLGGLIWLGVFPSTIAYYIFNLGSESLSATIMASSGLLIPFVAAIAAYLMLGEVFTLIELVGGAMIISGLFLALFKS